MMTLAGDPRVYIAAAVLLLIALLLIVVFGLLRELCWRHRERRERECYPSPSESPQESPLREWRNPFA